MSRYSPTFDNNATAKTVILSFPENLHISCSKVDGTVVMNLESCSEMQISLEQDMDRFLFFMRTTEINTTMFESVKYQGWFISTSSEERESVEMCQVDAHQRIISFDVFRENTP
ncbi:interleukin-1 beta [Nothobranchius furzeri]|uniref:interleukin-1 beta n=1 Tax=Nothobranchius furzeri TaxID=105023 RepID=UPI003904C31F